MRRPSSGDLWLLARMSGWAALLPALKFVLPLPRLVALVTPGERASARDASREQRVARIAERLYRTTPRLSRDNSLERSLVTYRYLVRAGSEPVLVVGMRKQEELHGHVWVTLDGRPVHDTEEFLSGFVPVMTFPPTSRDALPEAPTART
jgi:hypothetical protein